MLSKSQIQYITSLALTKHRRTNNQFIAEGPKLIDELLSSRFVCDKVYAVKDWIEKNKNKIYDDIEVFEISEQELQKISTLKTPNQVLAIVNIPKQALGKTTMAGNNINLMLDRISDPGNMGTIIRTADWFGVQNLICSEDCVDVFNPKVVQATMGSIFRVNIHYVSPEIYLQDISTELPIYGTRLEGENLYDAELEKNCIMLIGNESHGIKENLSPFIKKYIRIPHYSIEKSSSAESLNASIAAAIVIAEHRRRFPNND